MKDLLFTTLKSPPKIEVKRSSRRKTVGFKVKDGKVEVTAPNRLPDHIINEMVQQRLAWIEKQLQKIAARPRPQEKTYCDGEGFLYQGKNCPLNIVEGDFIGVKLEDDNLLVSPNSTVPEGKRAEHIKSLLKTWYLACAQNHFEARTEHFASILDVKPRSIIIKSYKARWGSCSVKGDISYNWKLIMAPIGVIDYVVVHELCHMLEHNHSPKFWRNVRYTMREYKTHRTWLKNNGTFLTI